MLVKCQTNDLGTVQLVRCQVLWLGLQQMEVQLLEVQQMEVVMWLEVQLLEVQLGHQL